MSYLDPKNPCATPVRVGFIVDDFLPSLRACLRYRTFQPLWSGWPSNTAGTVMRFGWVSEYVSQLSHSSWVYELYRPWRSYQAVVFLKSMGEDCLELAARLRDKGRCTIFDANVDYFSPATGTWYYEGMAPTPEQREQSSAMARTCDGVIADSRYLYEKVLKHNARAVWIPDNIPDDWIADDSDWRMKPGDKLPLLWSGATVKLFELLRVEPVLRHFKKHIKLRLITGNLEALSRIYEPWQGRLRRLLTDMECELIMFRDIPSLLARYDQGGVCISPRFLDNSYNMGHTEWKISLAMARGRLAIASPQPSYCDLNERAGGKGVRICTEEKDWNTVLDKVLSENFDWEEEQRRACEVVKNYYSTSITAKRHVEWIASLIH